MGYRIWIALKVWGGVDAEVRAYKTEESARRQLALWANDARPDYDFCDICQTDVIEEDVVETVAK